MQPSEYRFETCPRCGERHIPPSPTLTERYKLWVERVLAEIRHDRKVGDIERRTPA